MLTVITKISFLGLVLQYSFKSIANESSDNKQFEYKNFINELMLQTPEDRIIEPTSVVLGHVIVSSIKNSTKSPLEIFKELDQTPHLYNWTHTSLLSYLQTLEPGLVDYCSLNSVKTINRSQLTEIEHAAIPLEILSDYQTHYLSLVNKNAINSHMNKEEKDSNLKSIADEYQMKRYQCRTAQKIRDIENQAEKILCFDRETCQKARKIHTIVSSPEASFPRIQYSINGYTRYVYNELLKNENLLDLLEATYALENEWLNLTKEKQDQDHFFSFVVNNLVLKKYHVKDIFLVLAYSMRNMPSLDVEYAISPQKALMLEVYFWKFKLIRNQIEKKSLLVNVFPKHSYKVNPGIYHYLTAALLGCEARLAGLSHPISSLMGVASKAGYKGDKFLKSLEMNKLKTEGIGYAIRLLQKQGAPAALIAGGHAASFGSSVCGNFANIETEFYRKKLKSANERIFKPSYGRSTKNTQKQLSEYTKVKTQLSLELKTKLRSVLND